MKAIRRACAFHHLSTSCPEMEMKTEFYWLNKCYRLSIKLATPSYGMHFFITKMLNMRDHNLYYDNVN